MNLYFSINSISFDLTFDPNELKNFSLSVIASKKSVSLSITMFSKLLGFKSIAVCSVAAERFTRASFARARLA